MTLFRNLFLASLMLCASLAQANTALQPRFSDEALLDILKNDGYAAVTLRKKGVIQVKINGSTYLLFNGSDGDLQTAYAVSGVDLDCQDINEWNRTRRLSRAYLDADGDPVLESDLLANGGLTPGHVTEFFRVFVDSARQFKIFLLRHNHDR